MFSCAHNLGALTRNFMRKGMKPRENFGLQIQSAAPVCEASASTGIGPLRNLTAAPRTRPKAGDAQPDSPAHTGLDPIYADCIFPLEIMHHNVQTALHRFLTK